MNKQVVERLGVAKDKQEVISILVGTGMPREQAVEAAKEWQKKVDSAIEQIIKSLDGKETWH